MSICEIIGGGDPGVLLLCDHASNRVPDDIDLGIDPALLDRHIAIDIGAAPLTRALASALDAPAILATVSRLVIDLNREIGHGGLIPERSDGHTIFGNVDLDPAERIARFHRPYHATIEAEIDRSRSTASRPRWRRGARTGRGKSASCRTATVAPPISRCRCSPRRASPSATTSPIRGRCSTRRSIVMRKRAASHRSASKFATTRSATMRALRAGRKFLRPLSRACVIDLRQKARSRHRRAS
jgi:hypothetical protein